MQKIGFFRGGSRTPLGHLSGLWGCLSRSGAFRLGRSKMMLGGMTYGGFVELKELFGGTRLRTVCRQVHR
jgi:hypothetical protein